MTTVYWWLLGGGLAVTLLLFLVGDWLDGLLDGLDGPVDPFTAVAGATVAGGAGLLLTDATALGVPAVAALAAAIGVAAAVALDVFYVRPMRRAEMSTGFSVQEYAGKTGELTTSISPGGYGEVVVRMSGATTFQTATSFTGEALPDGARVVVVEVAPDGVLRVAPLTDDDVNPSPEPTRTSYSSRT